MTLEAPGRPAGTAAELYVEAAYQRILLDDVEGDHESGRRGGDFLLSGASVAARYAHCPFEL
jgi:hypothetical protein